MPKTSTLENVATLALLRFLGQEASYRDVARFLGISERQAATIIAYLLKRGLIEKSTYPGYYVFRFPSDKAREVISNIVAWFTKAFVSQVSVYLRSAPKEGVEG